MRLPVWHSVQVGTILVLRGIQWPPPVPAFLNGEEGRKGREDLWGLLGWEFHKWAFHKGAGWAGSLTNHCYNFRFRGYQGTVLCDHHWTAHSLLSLPTSDFGHTDAHMDHTLELT